MSLMRKLHLQHRKKSPEFDNLSGKRDNIFPIAMLCNFLHLISYNSYTGIVQFVKNGFGFLMLLKSLWIFLYNLFIDYSYSVKWIFFFKFLFSIQFNSYITIHNQYMYVNRRMTFDLLLYMLINNLYCFLTRESEFRFVWLNVTCVAWKYSRNIFRNKNFWSKNCVRVLDAWMSNCV